MSTCFKSRSRERGDALLEALIGVLITTLIGGGMAHVVATIMNSQRDAKVENIVVEKLRGQLHSGGVGLCDAAKISLKLTSTVEKDATVSCATATPTTLEVNGVSLAVTPPRRIDLKVAAADLEAKGASGKNDVDLLLSSRQ